jgi:hypothetical protein
MKTKNPLENAEPELRELIDFTSEFNKESDRGAVLVAGSRIDEVLKSILMGYLRTTKSTNELLEGINAPLGSFSARASACHALGLLEDIEFNEITLIRKIRNEFGHKWKNISFESHKIRSLAMTLPWLGPSEEEEGATPRARFNFAVVILLTDLLWRERLARKEKIQSRMWPNRMRSWRPTSPGDKLRTARA